MTITIHQEFLLSEPHLSKFIELTKERFQAVEVWLFGSRARGDHRPDSDWDLLVVVPNEMPYEILDHLPLRRVAREAGLVADVVAERLSDLRSLGTVPSTRQHAVLSEGKRIA